MSITLIDDKTLFRTSAQSRGRIVLSGLILLNCVLFIAGLIWPGLREALMLHSPALPTAPLTTAFLNWRAMASYTLVHAGPTHLFFNMLFLWIIGNDIIRRRGLRRMLLYYIAGAVAGGLGFLTVSAFIPAWTLTSLCGASAAILGLCGAELRGATRLQDCNKAERRIRLIVWLAIGVSLLGSLSLPALATHICGLATGLAIAKW
ncbi:MAG: rhomboid family intramembrane serine protease [Muribaculaceae bacterium]|nr:rhomboid family intramembrane serine protease [Muribaculaceae bacterium]